jgi:hypothetical protein
MSTKLSSMTHPTLLSLSLAVLAACGSSSTPPPQTPAPAAAPAAPVAWKDMDATQRETFMKEVVMPRSKELFVAFDPKSASMDCKTCHGDGATDGTFEMPNPKIKPLPNTPEAFMAWVSKDAEAGRYAEFMATKLEPAVAEMLQLEPFDPKTNTGEFSCGNCHQLVDANGQIVPDPRAEEHEHEHEHHHAP